MDNYTTVVTESAGKTIANLREQQKRRNIFNGVLISALALTVIFTGSLLGATTAHNRELRQQLAQQPATNQTQTVSETPRANNQITLNAPSEELNATTTDETNTENAEPEKTAAADDRTIHIRTQQRHHYIPYRQFHEYYRPRNFAAGNEPTPVKLPHPVTPDDPSSSAR